MLKYPQDYVVMAVQRKDRVLYKVNPLTAFTVIAKFTFVQTAKRKIKLTRIHITREVVIRANTDVQNGEISLALAEQEIRKHLNI